MKARTRYCKDTDGLMVRPGDWIRFCYGIPPVAVDAEVIQRNGRLIALTPGHTPPEATIPQLRRWVGTFQRIETPHRNRP